MSGLNDMRQCWQPRQWFECEGEPDIFTLTNEDAFMWVYREVCGNFQVGYYAPDKTWFCDGEYATRDTAVARVNFLNGGKRAT